MSFATNVYVDHRRSSNEPPAPAMMRKACPERIWVAFLEPNSALLHISKRSGMNKLELVPGLSAPVGGADYDRTSTVY